MAIEEKVIIDRYIDYGFIHPRYLGQYVEIERRRLLQEQESQFIAYRNGPVRDRGTGSKKRSFESQHPFSDYDDDEN